MRWQGLLVLVVVWTTITCLASEPTYDEVSASDASTTSIQSGDDSRTEPPSSQFEPSGFSLDVASHAEDDNASQADVQATSPSEAFEEDSEGPTYELAAPEDSELEVTVASSLSAVNDDASPSMADDAAQMTQDSDLLGAVVSGDEPETPPGDWDEVWWPLCAVIERYHHADNTPFSITTLKISIGREIEQGERIATGSTRFGLTRMLSSRAGKVVNLRIAEGASVNDGHLIGHVVSRRSK